MDKIDPASVPAETYTREYFEEWCQGYEEFHLSGGQALPARLQIPLDLAAVTAEMKVLDIGCGRGELVLNCAQKGARVWGIDYAPAAIELTSEAVTAAPEAVQQRIRLMRADARMLPLDDGSVDVVFMLDVVEHLETHELDLALTEIRRVLKPNGRFIAHTMPNLWYYHYGYPIFRLFQRLRGNRLPRDPRDRWRFKEVHVNEQTPRSLANTLRKIGFHTQIWLRSTQNYDEETSPLVRNGMRFLVSAPLIKRIFCNDIFAVATKS